VDHAVSTKIKEVLTLDRPFVKKTAWVGTESIPHAFMENFHNFSQREIALRSRRGKKRWTGWWESSSQFSFSVLSEPYESHRRYP
jgi:hypothetical protein